MRWLITCFVLCCGVSARAESLESKLLAEPAAALGQAAREQGDPRRGAILFHQPTMACTKCHAVGDATESLGPDLTTLPADTSDADLVDAVLRPSKQIRKGYEAVTLLLQDGRIVTGLPAQSMLWRHDRLLAAGSLFDAKSARHALPAVVPHHGTLLRVSPDGERTEILANGFRAANGVCLNPDGTFIVTDQEGHWNPKNRINWVTPGTGGDARFYGNMYGYHDVTDESDEAMEPPLCWITNAFDRSPAELLWVDSPRWGPLNGSLLNFSYGYGKVYVVPFEEVNGGKQGGMCALPIEPLPTGIMRGRFSPHDGQLYTCGMFAWASSQQGQEGGLYRVRVTGKPAWLPVALHARQSLLQIRWSDPVDAQAGSDPHNYAVKVWSLRRTKQYGSDHYDEHPLEVTSAEVTPDGRTLVLQIPDVAPTWCMEIRCVLQGTDGERIERVIHNTIHALGD